MTLINKQINKRIHTQSVKVIICLIATLLLSACASRLGNINDACQIVDSNPWHNALKESSERWDVPSEVILAFIYQESKFIADAKPPRYRFLGIIPLFRPSSAYGYAQALDGTWDDYRDSSGRFFADRDDIEDAVDFVGWYIAGTHRELGIPTFDAFKHYLAYHEGRGGYKRKTYEKKQWLVGVAKKTSVRAQNYRQQLLNCYY